MLHGSALAMLALLTGCRSLGADPGLPAVIVQPDDSSRAALQATLSEIFGGSDVRLAGDALTRSSLLTLETGYRQIPGTRSATGRVVSAPFSFRLVKAGEDCMLIDLRDGKRHLLADTKCRPE